MNEMNLIQIEFKNINVKDWAKLWNTHAREYRDFLPFELFWEELSYSLQDPDSLILEARNSKSDDLIGFAIIKRNDFIFTIEHFVINDTLRLLEFVTKIIDYLEGFGAEFVSIELFEKNAEYIDPFLQIGFEPYNVEVWMRRSNTPVDFDYNTDVTFKITDDSNLFAELSNKIFSELDNIEMTPEDVLSLPHKFPGVRPEFLYIAYLNNVPVGVMYLRIDERWNNYYNVKRGWILGLGVLPEYQGKGIGKALLAKGINILNSKGVNEIFVITDFNMGPYRLYKKCGFEDDEKIINFILGIK